MKRLTRREVLAAAAALAIAPVLPAVSEETYGLGFAEGLGGPNPRKIGKVTITRHSIEWIFKGQSLSEEAWLAEFRAQGHDHSALARMVHDTQERMRARSTRCPSVSLRTSPDFGCVRTYDADA